LRYDFVPANIKFVGCTVSNEVFAARTDNYFVIAFSPASALVINNAEDGEQLKNPTAKLARINAYGKDSRELENRQAVRIRGSMGKPVVNVHARSRKDCRGPFRLPFKG
jgi:hypothetical protein